MIRLARYLKRFKKEVIFGPFFKLVEAVFELIVPLVMAKILDVGVKNADTGYVFRMGGVMLLLGAVGLCCALVCQYSGSKASQGVGTDLRNDLFRHIESLSHKELDKLGASSMLTRLLTDVNQIQVATAMLIRLVIRAPFLVVGATVMSFLLDVKLSLIFLVIIPLVAIALYYIMSRSVPFYRVTQRKLDRISLITRENLSGARVIRAFSKQDEEEKRFDEAAEDLTRTVVNVGKLSALLNPITYLIMNFAIVAIVWFGGMRVDSGALSQGQIVAFVNYMTQILLALVVVANLVVLFTKASASAARINEVFDTKPSVVEGTAEEVIPKAGTPKIEFRNVYFSYHEQEGNEQDEDIKNLNLKIFPGETIGVIGGTGSGKSTLVNLIPRFYDVNRGEVLVDGVNVRDYKFSVLRKKVGMVPQKASLFSGTLGDNLRMANKEATDEKLREAVADAQAEEFVEKLPDGYDTIVEQGGRNFSGGQKQRLTIARALAAEPEILILDDSSSALDYATDAKLRKALRKKTESAGMTVILVSQRASSLRHADKIIVLDDGDTVGLGTHDELLQTCDIYREICRSQESGGGEQDGK